MRKKARIDVLDIQEPEELEEELPPREEEPTEEEPEAKSRLRSLNWKILIFIALSLCVAAFATLSIYHFLSQPKKVSERAATATPITPVLLEVKDLSCVVSDAAGNSRLLMFEVTIVPAPGKSLVWNVDSPELRSLIIQIVTESPLTELLTAQGREKVKERIRESLEHAQGSGSVNAVFITSWKLL